MRTLQEIKKQEEEKHTALFKECGLFWAFSTEQFEKNKTPLQEGDKYTSIGAGGYLPKRNVDLFCNGMEAIKKWRSQEVKSNKLQYQQIAYELSNHECYYTGDISVVIDLFKDTYTAEQIQQVYSKERKKHIDS